MLIKYIDYNELRRNDFDPDKARFKINPSGWGLLGGWCSCQVFVLDVYSAACSIKDFRHPMTQRDDDFRHPMTQRDDGGDSLSV